ncbi:Rne/Rng family ribonuclease [Bacillus sp. JJ1764]|uniref:Rne/Rng family ribonuclease n=1 Tax=Bacillus sp. JJ1764 TaxID=3122964 RepID=UPI002FFD6A60
MLIVNLVSREKRLAYLQNSRVEKLVFDRPEHRSLVGNIYFGTVSKVLPGMNAVFVDIGEGKNGYLHRDQLPSLVASEDKQKTVTAYVHQGEKLFVQVEKDATGTKGPKLTGIIEFQGTNLIYLPNGHYIAVSKKIQDIQKSASLRNFANQYKMEQEGLIFRTSSISSTEEELITELSQLRERYQIMVRNAALMKKPGIIFQKDSFTEIIFEQAERMTAGEVIVDDLHLKKIMQAKYPKLNVIYYKDKENIFSTYKVEHAIEKALKRMVWLENGAYLIFDETEALTIVDVNTGKFSGKSDYQDTVLKTNQLAARETLHQLRLRDIGGIVLIDFINMKQEQDRKAILETIEKELLKDEKRTKLIGFTPLGILQLTRKKTKVTLSENLQVKCSVCEGTGRVLSSETVAFQMERELLEHRHSDYEAVLIETTNEVKAALLGDNEIHRQVLEDLLHMKLCFTTTATSKPYYLIKQFGTESEIAQKAGECY